MKSRGRSEGCQIYKKQTFALNVPSKAENKSDPSVRRIMGVRRAVYGADCQMDCQSAHVCRTCQTPARPGHLPCSRAVVVRSPPPNPPKPRHVGDLTPKGCLGDWILRGIHLLHLAIYGIRLRCLRVRGSAPFRPRHRSSAGFPLARRAVRPQTAQLLTPQLPRGSAMSGGPPKPAPARSWRR